MHAMVIGEHGDSAVPVWSAACVGPVLLSDYPSRERPRLAAEDRARISADVVQAGQEVIKRKGATFYATASRREVTPPLYGVNDVCLSLPAIVGKDGIREILALPLSPDEKVDLQRSAAAIKAMLREVEYQ